MEKDYKSALSGCTVELSEKGGLLTPDNGGNPLELKPQASNLLHYFLLHHDTPITSEELVTQIGIASAAAVPKAVERLRESLNKVSDQFGDDHLPKKGKHEGNGYIFYLEPSRNPGHPAEQEDAEAGCGNFRDIDLTGWDVQLRTVFSPGRKDRLYFSGPPHAIPFRNALGDLRDHAFKQYPVHFIAGQRGMGKTELSRAYADALTKEENSYHTIVSTEYFGNSLYQSVLHLSCTGKDSRNAGYLQKMKLLELLEKPTLLILDNYDNRAACMKEFDRLNSLVYQDLIDTGCDLLITSQLDMSGCPGTDQTVMESFSPEELETLFLEMAPDRKRSSLKKEHLADPSLLRKLLTDTLLGNTYLTILAAGQTGAHTIGQISEAFQSLSASAFSVETTINHGGAWEKGTVMELYRKMMDMDTLLKSTNRKQFMEVLSLVPLRGIPLPDFLRWSFEEKEQPIMGKMAHDLCSGYWCFLREDGSIYMHPCVRELVAEKIVPGDIKFLSKYLNFVIEKNRMDTYEEDLHDYFSLALSAYEIISKREIFPIHDAFLTAMICSNYDNLQDSEQAMHFGREALAKLDKISVHVSPRDPKSILNLAKTYNTVGYSMFGCGTEKACRYAMKAYHTAEALLDRIPDYADDVKTATVLKLIGNKAAVCRTRHLYDEAILYHKQSLRKREQLDLKKGANLKLLAISHRSLATDYFDLSENCPPAKSTENLIYSLTHAQKSLKLLKAVWESEENEKDLRQNARHEYQVTLTLALKATIRHALMTETQDSAFLEKLQEQLLFNGSYFGSIDPMPRNLRNCALEIYNFLLLADRTGFPVQVFSQTAALFRSLCFKFPPDWESLLHAIEEKTAN